MGRAKPDNRAASGGAASAKPSRSPARPEKFAERAQHHDIAAANLRSKARAARPDVHEGLVDHQHAAARAERLGNVQQIGSDEQPSVRIVGICNNDEVGSADRAEIV